MSIYFIKDAFFAASADHPLLGRVGVTEQMRGSIGPDRRAGRASLRHFGRLVAGCIGSSQAMTDPAGSAAVSTASRLRAAAPQGQFGFPGARSNS